MRQIFIQSRKDEYLTFTTSLLYIRHLTCTFSHLILMTTQEVGTGRMLVSWMWRQRLRGIRSFPGLGRAGVWLQFSDFRDPVFHTMRSASCVCLPCARPCVQHCHMQTSSRSTSCGPVAIPLTCSDFTEWSFPLRSAVTEAAIGGNSGKASWPRISHCHYLALWLYHSLSTASPNFGFHIGQRRRLSWDSCLPFQLQHSTIPATPRESDVKRREDHLLLGNQYPPHPCCHGDDESWADGITSSC